MKLALPLIVLVLVGCGAAAPVQPTADPGRTADPPPVVAAAPESPPDPQSVTPPAIAAAGAAGLEGDPVGQPRVLVSARAVWIDDTQRPPTIALTLTAGLSTPEQRDGQPAGSPLVALRDALAQAGPFGPRVIVVTADVPSRTLAEVLATFGAAGNNVARIAVKAGDRIGGIRVGLAGRMEDGRVVLNLTEINPMARVMPRAEMVSLDEDSPVVTIAMSASGYQVARRGVVYAPGCARPRAAGAATPTVAASGAVNDFAGLASCLRTLRASTNTPRVASVTADADVATTSVLATLAVVHADATGPLFDHVVFR